MRNYTQQIRNTLATPELKEGHRATMQRFAEEKADQDVSASTRAQYLSLLRDLALYLGAPFETMDEKDLKAYIRFIKKAKAPSTVEREKIMLKTFFNWLYEWEPPRWLRLLTRKGSLKTQKVESPIKAEDLLDPTEIQALLRAATPLVLQAYLATLVRTAARPSEALLLQLRFVNAHPQDGTSFQIPTLKRRRDPLRMRRPIHSFSVTPFIRALLKVHPAPDDLMAPLFHLKGEPLEYGMASAALQRARKKAKLTKKKVHLHLFRHTTLTEWAMQLPRLGGEYVFKKMAGWSENSTMPTVYVKLSDDKLFLAQRRAKGADVREREVLPTEACPSCDEITASFLESCLFCSTKL